MHEQTFETGFIRPTLSKSRPKNAKFYAPNYHYAIAVAYY